MDKQSKSTLNDYRDPAVICRERGWKPGTRLIGTEKHGNYENTEIITITAIGERKILAVCHAHGDELIWVLNCRDWTEVKS